MLSWNDRDLTSVWKPDNSASNRMNLGGGDHRDFGPREELSPQVFYQAVAERSGRERQNESEQFRNDESSEVKSVLSPEVSRFLDKTAFYMSWVSSCQAIRLRQL